MSIVDKKDYKLVTIELPKPKMGSKGWLLDRWGNFNLEQGPGVLRGIACTHTGSGTLEVVDGIPNEDGFYPDEEIVNKGSLHPDYNTANGRMVFKSPGSVMGMWTLNVGLYHGLTIHAYGGTDSAPPCITFIWEPYKILGAPKAPPAPLQND